MLVTIPYITTHAMGRFITRGAQLSPSPIQRFLRARQVCPAISRRYKCEQRVRYDEELIYIQDAASGAVLTVMQRADNNFRWNAMIREQENSKC